MIDFRLRADIWRSSLASFICLLLIGGCAKEQAAPPPQSVKVKVEVVQPSEVSDKSTLIGRMDSRHAIVVYPKVDGHISRIQVRPGQQIKKGDPLIEIDDLQQQAAVAEKESDVRVAQADYDKEVAALKSIEAERTAQEASTEYEKHEYVRNYWLQQRDVVSAATVDAHDRQYKVAKSKLLAIDASIAAQKRVILRAARGIESARSQLKEQQEQLSYYRIVAPFNGSVGDVPIKQGDYVNSQTKLTTVSQIKPLELKVLVPKDLAPSLKMGMTLELTDDYDKVLASCPIFYIDPIVDPSNQSILVKALFANDAEQYRPDQEVKTRLVLSEARGVTIPTDALTFIAGRPFAYVLASAPGKGQIAQQRLVDLTQIENNRATVKSGIKPGDRLIVSGVQFLSDGVPVTVE